jgi:hypothetical protein
MGPDWFLSGRHCKAVSRRKKEGIYGVSVPNARSGDHIERTQGFDLRSRQAV